MALFPQENLERVLAHDVVTPASPHHRAPWHSSIPTSLLQTLRARPFLAHPVCTLVLPYPRAEDAEVLRMLERVDVLDVTLPNSNVGAVGDLAGAIQSLRGLRALTIRKGAGTYLDQPAPRALLDALADAVAQYPELHTATLTFPLSGDPALSTLTTALAAAPALTTLRTPLPALWAPTYAVVAANPALGRICLVDDLGSPTSTSSSPSPSSSTCPAPACASPSSPSTSRHTHPARPRTPLLLSCIWRTPPRYPFRRAFPRCRAPPRAPERAG
ncbi:hypothetical protein B0H13DRAFT_2652360 [Mycena leptocephala]|nr:hypothetical protein B0H13DRAFT_2652360 [Mycena leptocephala]